MFTTLAKAKKILLFPLKKKRVGMIYNEDPLTALLKSQKNKLTLFLPFSFRGSFKVSKGMSR